jgi:hypothetical protein
MCLLINCVLYPQITLAIFDFTEAALEPAVAFSAYSGAPSGPTSGMCDDAQSPYRGAILTKLTQQIRNPANAPRF